MKNIFKLLAVSVFAAFTGCVNSDDYKNPDLSGDCITLTPNKAVDVLSTPPPATYPAFTQYTADDIIEAYVVSSDEGGNFYKSISFVSVDGTKAFSMEVDNYNLYNEYPPGRKVYIKLKDRMYQQDANAIVVGSRYDKNATPTNLNDDELGRISGIEYKNIILKSCDYINEDDLVNHVTINQAKSNNYLNKLIEIDNVQFTDISVGKKYFDPAVNNVGSATNHNITDIDGNTVIVRVSQYANFAGETVTGNSGTIRGVMTKFGTTYQFMIRTLSDVRLTTPRVVPTTFFEETFSTNFANWVKFSVTGPSQNWTLNTANGNPGNCADMNGYAGSAQNNEDWLISPVLNLSTLANAKLTFQTSRPFSGTALQVLVSTNYSGSGAPSAATWTVLTGATLASSTTWVDSGNLSLAPYVGNPNVRVAFKYVSTTSGASQWRVDNVKVVYF